MDEEQVKEKFATFVENKEPNPVKWVDIKYLRDMPGQKKGGYTPVVKQHTLTSALLFFVSLVNEPIPDNAKMQKPIIIAERKRVIELLNKAFKGVSNGKISEE